MLTYICLLKGLSAASFVHDWFLSHTYGRTGPEVACGPLPTLTLCHTQDVTFTWGKAMGSPGVLVPGPRAGVSMVGPAFPLLRTPGQALDPQPLSASAFIRCQASGLNHSRPESCRTLSLSLKHCQLFCQRHLHSPSESQPGPQSSLTPPCPP